MGSGDSHPERDLPALPRRAVKTSRSEATQD